jgi:hypothetical protein
VRSGVKPTVSYLVNPPHAVNDNLIERTLEVWVPRLGRERTHEDARQIVENMVGFFEILNEWWIEEATSSVRLQPKRDRHESGMHRSQSYAEDGAGGDWGAR